MADPTLGPVQVNDLLSVTVLGSAIGQQVMNTFHFQVTQVPAVRPDRWLAYEQFYAQFAIDDGVLSTLRGCIAQNCTVDTVKLQWIAPSRQIYRDFFEGSAGAWPHDCKTPNLAASIERRGELASRTSIGRLQVFGLPDDAYLAGVVTNAYANALADIAVKMNDVLTTDSGIAFTPVLTGFSGTPPVRHVVTIVAGSFKRTVRVMRRRTVGVGK